MHVIYIHSKSNKMETTVVQRIAFIKKNEKLTNEAFALKTTVPVETIKSMFSKKTNPNLDIARNMKKVTEANRKVIDYVFSK